MQQAQTDDTLGDAVDSAVACASAKYRVAARMALLEDQPTQQAGMIGVQLRPVAQRSGPAGPASGTVAGIARCQGLHRVFPFAAKGPRPAHGGPRTTKHFDLNQPPELF